MGAGGCNAPGYPTLGDYPLIDVRCAKAVAISNVYAYVGSSSREMVRHDCASSGWNRISGASLFCGGSREDYQVVHTRGSLQLADISFEGSPAVAHIKVAAAVSATHQEVNVAANSSSPLHAG